VEARTWLADGRAELERGRLLLWFFYIWTLTKAFNAIEVAQSVAGGTIVWAPKVHIGILSWLSGDIFPAAVFVATACSVVGAVVSAVYPGLRTARALFFVGHLLLVAVEYDLRGKIDHSEHTTVWVAFVFIFLPSFRRAAEDDQVRRAFNRIMWTAGAAVLLTYTLAGINKVGAGIGDLLGGRPSWLAPDGLVYVIANARPAAGWFLSDFLIGHPWLTYGVQLGVLYLEGFALVVAFRPRLLRPWGLALLGMHLAIKASMGISFSNSIIPLMLFVVGSPFATQGGAIRTLQDLPLFGRPATAILSRIRSRRDARSTTSA
jgi:hypothetical protein